MNQLVELLKKLGTAGSVIAATIAALWAFTVHEHQARLDFQKPWIEKHIDFCVDVARAVGRLTASKNDAEWNDDKVTFEQLFWGNLILVEDTDVKRSMGAFREKLGQVTFEEKSQLEGVARDVSISCRNQIERLMSTGWQITSSQ